MRTFVEFVATAGMGRRIPRGPGTYGTLVAVPLVLALWHLGPILYMAAAAFLMVFAIVIAQFYEDMNGRHDAKEVVIDEIAGFVITMTWLPLTWQAFVVGFVLFRALDIFKPFPIGMLDQKVKGGIGVVVDDVAAGIIANVLLQVLYTQTDILGVRL
jgi:phosphatidylglycerophosphatase A